MFFSNVNKVAMELHMNIKGSGIQTNYISRPQSGFLSRLLLENKHELFHCSRLLNYFNLVSN